MSLRAGHTLLLALIWTTCSSLTLGTDGLKARIRVRRESIEELRPLLSFRGRMSDNLKLVHASGSTHIYAGGPDVLYMLNQGEHPTLKKVDVPIFEPECPSTGCGYKISLLKEGKNGNPLFMCGTRDKDTMCCDVDSGHRSMNCFQLYNATLITQPSLHVGDSLYYTVSTGNIDQPGLYSSHMDQYTWPPARNTGETETLHAVNYSMQADRGGSKSVLQYRWTSMLTARLFCGDEKKGLTYTELLDVAVLEDAKWEGAIIYGLFKNAYNLTAVCVYKMSDIINVFASNNIKDNTQTLSSPRPGECVANSQKLSSSFLEFMESLPEMNQWIKPARAPLLFMHHHYTHLQVDRVKSWKSENSHHDVLFMVLENGNIHKILDQDGDPFIIAQYKPFKSRTHISSTLLDRNTKKLFVSSSSEVIQIDLYNCSVYGSKCDSCVMARDPYCGWDGMCSANNGSLVQDVIHGNPSVCENDVPTNDESHDNRDSPISVSQDSKFYLKCPMESLHASYTWEQQGRTMACVSTDQGCLLLIDSMSEKDEGVYTCIATENGYERTIVRHQLQMNTASVTRATNTALACVLFLISVIC